MTKSTFNKEEVSNFKCQTESQFTFKLRNVEIISTPRDGKVKRARLFQIALKGYGRNLPPLWG